MYALGQLAHGTLSIQQFNQQHAGFPYETVKITKFSEGKSEFQSQQMTETELLDFAAGKYQGSPSGAVAALADLSLIVIPRIERIWERCLLISEPNLLKLFDLFELDPFALYFLSNGYMGYNHWTTGNGQTTHYIATSFYTAVWCCTTSKSNTELKSTRIILFNRTPGRERKALDMTEDELGNMLHESVAYLEKPSLVPFTVALQIVKWLDRASQRGLSTVRQMEANTDHGNWRKSGVQVSGIDDITKWSKEMSSLLVDLANHFRHIDIATGLLTLLREELTRPEMTKDPMTGALRKDNTESLRAATQTLERHLAWRKTSIQYLHERVKSQVSMLSTMLTHEDARASIELADAAKRDGSSMKTIAVVTMAFLPATFFAALFAMPSLQWDQPAGRIIQPTFWIYWVFTVPATLLVFIIWFLLSHHGSWRRVNTRISRV
ncbi:uncharacterized protein J7T55_003381 [Diaporthe amygdali]|uniref:uncharacterized protein n=1 Tax=Phomopsis amygdali TaxID=1214568 RepID=UPI0022FF06D9|nr:uncharacterized protein J7T55_003381 [Diaporthe amygdali]KAJ0116967.1 uncharacterized protein J7T55_003381 [Diaporthe amygdali]